MLLAGMSITPSHPCLDIIPCQWCPSTTAVRWKHRLMWGLLHTPSMTYVPGCENTILASPAPWGPTTMTAEWKRRIVSLREGVGLSINKVYVRLKSVAARETTFSIAVCSVKCLDPLRRIRTSPLRGGVVRMVFSRLTILWASSDKVGDLRGISGNDFVSITTTCRINSKLRDIM